MPRTFLNTSTPPFDDDNDDDDDVFDVVVEDEEEEEEFGEPLLLLLLLLLPPSSSSLVRSSMVFRSLSYEAESSACEVSRALYRAVRADSWASRSLACFSLRSRKARWAARF